MESVCHLGRTPEIVRTLPVASMEAFRGGDPDRREGVRLGGIPERDLIEDILEERGLAAGLLRGSLNAARAIGIEDRKGSLDVQKDADLVLLDDGMNVQMTVAEGLIVYRR